MINYPVVIHKDRDSDYGVTVPDLTGCFSAGRNVDEALAMAQEAVELHLEGLIDEGQPVPRPRTIEDHKRNREYRGGIWALVSVSPPALRARARRINISLPQRVLRAIDRFAKAENETRSGLLAKAAADYIRNQPPLTIKRRGKGTFRIQP